MLQTMATGRFCQKKEAPPRDAPLFHKDNAAQFGGTLRAVYFIVLILRKSR